MTCEALSGVCLREWTLDCCQSPKLFLFRFFWGRGDGRESSHVASWQIAVQQHQQQQQQRQLCRHLIDGLFKCCLGVWATDKTTYLILGSLEYLSLRLWFKDC